MTKRLYYELLIPRSQRRALNRLIALHRALRRPTVNGSTRLSRREEREHVRALFKQAGRFDLTVEQIARSAPAYGLPFRAVRHCVACAKEMLHGGSECVNGRNHHYYWCDYCSRSTLRQRDKQYCLDAHHRGPRLLYCKHCACNRSFIRNIGEENFWCSVCIHNEGSEPVVTVFRP